MTNLEIAARMAPLIRELAELIEELAGVPKAGQASDRPANASRDGRLRVVK